MSFDLYFVGTQNKEHDEYMIKKNCSRLFSYAEKPFYTIKRYLEHPNKLFIDSGAFSIANKVRRGKNLTIDDYIEFINSNTRPDLYASFDVIPRPLTTETAKNSAEQSLNNYLYMLDKLDKPEKLIPVYHYGEDFKYLYQILKGYNGYKPKYIAYGGRGGVHTNKLYESLDQFFKIIKVEYPEVKTHAFGITVLKLLEKYPFTSCDSTSYLKTAVNGSIYVECFTKTIKISKQTIKDPLNYLHLNDHLKEIIEKEVKQYGYTIEELQESFRSRFKFNIDYFLRWQKKYKFEQKDSIKKKKLF